MKYLRLLFLFLITGLGGHSQLANAYAELYYGSFVDWEYAIDRRSGERIWAWDTYTTANFIFPVETTISYTNPSTIIFDEIKSGTLLDITENPAMTLKKGKLEMGPEWTPLKWEIEIDLVFEFGRYGSFTSYGGDGTCQCDTLVLHDDEYYFRGPEEPYPISAYFTTQADPYGWIIFQDEVEVPESSSFALLLTGLILLPVRRLIARRRSGSNQ